MSILEKKLKAVETFKNELLKTEVAKSVAEIILFGSTAKRKISAESDIDLLVLGTANLKGIQEAASTTAYNIMLETGESIEPLVYCIDQLRYPHSYFLYTVLKEGKKMYAVSKEDLKNKEIFGYLSLAREYFDIAKKNREQQMFRAAVDIGYNAAELSAKACLLKKLDSLPKTHSGIVQKFSELYIKTKELEAGVGRKFNDSLDLRNSARYDYHAAIGINEANSVIEIATSIIEFADEKIKF